MDGVDVGDLQRDIAPAAGLTRRINGRRAVFLERNKALSKAALGFIQVVLDNAGDQSAGPEPEPESERAKPKGPRLAVR